jgi:hypothetical protein
MHLMWDAHFLLVDAKNAFNEGNQMAMCWTIHHQWPSGTWFTFNCYQHWLILVVRAANGTSLFLFSKEGMTAK